jgi:hypothetical protein
MGSLPLLCLLLNATFAPFHQTTDQILTYVPSTWVKYGLTSFARPKHADIRGEPSSVNTVAVPEDFRCWLGIQSIRYSH